MNDELQKEPQEEPRARNTSSIVWGLVLIGFGALFLYQRLTGAEIPRIWDLWPIAFVAIGTGQLVDRRPGAAVTMFLLGIWFMGVNWDWFGMTYRNSWPLVLVAIGGGMVVKSVSGEDERRGKGGKRC